MVALIVSEEVVSRAAELVAAEAVVMFVAAESDLEVELSHGAVVLQALPLPARVDHPGVDGFLNHRPADACRHNGLSQSDRQHSRDLMDMFSVLLQYCEKKKTRPY